MAAMAQPTGPLATMATAPRPLARRVTLILYGPPVYMGSAWEKRDMRVDKE